MPRFWNFVEADDIELHIEGEIVSDDDVWLYEWMGFEAISPNQFKDELKKYAGKPITVWVDSYGGDVFAAAGIYNALKEHKGAVTVKVGVKAMSSASVIAMAGDQILMSPMSVMMIHNPLTVAIGDMYEMRHMADVLDQVKETIINAYQIKTNRSRNKISEMMDAETWMSAKVAVKEGFADEMLYAAKDIIATDFAPSLMFNRLAIQNNASASMKRMLDIEKAHGQPEEITLVIPHDSGGEEKIELEKAKLALQVKLAELF